MTGKREKYRVIMRQDVDECEGERRKEWRATAEAKCGVDEWYGWSRRVEWKSPSSLVKRRGAPVRRSLLSQKYQVQQLLLVHTKVQELYSHSVGREDVGHIIIILIVFM